MNDYYVIVELRKLKVQGIYFLSSNLGIRSIIFDRDFSKININEHLSIPNNLTLPIYFDAEYQPKLIRIHSSEFVDISEMELCDFADICEDKYPEYFI